MNKKIESKIWQRVVNARSVIVEYPMSHIVPGKYLLSQILMLGNIEHIQCNLFPDDILIVKAIMQQCKNNIKSCDFLIKSHKTDILSPLALLNAKKIRMNSLYFYIIWSHKCEKLYLNNIQRIDNKWCKFVIDNCDCSGVAELTLDRIQFDSKIDKVLILAKFAQQFKNVTKVNILFRNEKEFEKILLFWQLLESVIDTNDVIVTLVNNINNNNKNCKNKMDIDKYLKYFSKVKWNVRQLKM